MKTLLDHLPAQPDSDSLLEGFLNYAQEAGLELYPHQEEAILELLAGNNVILDSPTGSGKSLVALAGHFASIATGKRSFYTAPIKALVSEKFFALCRDLGTDNVGMMTGDAAVNPTARVICCTAEILANLALRDGASAEVDQVVMDEFHFYSERDRGWAWQLPLLELPQVQFLLMSATLGPTRRFEEELTRRTGRPTILVKTRDRPVPLEFEYRHTLLHESITELLAKRLTPVYVVHFTQANAIEHAQSLQSIELCTKEEKQAIKEAIGGFRFDSPFGNDLRRYVHHGVGVHHAGLLPKYRLLVERLAQEGLLKIICGTDTLGVGINVPIRTVLFTQLCKYDGSSTRILSVREFKQIAGRAGRKGFDTLGTVWCQAPEHISANLRAENAAQSDPKKRKKLVKQKPPEFGYAAWSPETFTRLSTGESEPLTSSFHVSHAMMLNLLDRPGDGCGAVRKVLTSTHETRPLQRRHFRRAIAIYRSLLGAGILEVLDEPDSHSRRVRIDISLQEEFRLNQPLSPFVMEAVNRLDVADPDYAVDVLTIVESVLEEPMPVLNKQLDRAKTELLAKLKREGMEYEDRMAQLAEVQWPKPKADFLYPTFDAWSPRHPWVETNIKPKSVAREMYERGMTFREYVGDYGLKRAEGVLLRYLSDAYKALLQTVPMNNTTDELDDMIEWLGAVVRSTDSSLLDEWERLKNPTAEDQLAHVEPPADITRNQRAFRVMVRNIVFSWVQLLARGDYSRFANSAESRKDDPWTSERAFEALKPFVTEYGAPPRTDGDARGGQWFAVEIGPDRWDIRQILLDPADNSDWSITAYVDLSRSRAEDRAVVIFTGLGPTIDSSPAS